MAVLYIQHWYYYLPAIFEDGMGDGPPQRQSSTDNFRISPAASSPRVLVDAGIQRTQPNVAFDGYDQSQYMAGTTAAGHMDMRSLTGALPTLPLQNYPRPSFHHHLAGNQPTMYQYPYGAQFAGQAVTNFNMNPAQTYQQYPPGRFGYPSGPISTQPYQSAGHQMPQGMAQNSPGFTSKQHLYPHSQYSNLPIRGGHASRGPVLTGAYQNTSPQMTRTGSNSSTQAASSSALRGPPRKPKQSGHALWVGNLPPGTNIIDLKDYFSKDASEDIESVFLISKSNCAFVNYKSEESCQAAMSRFHETRFQGVRLVCRLRRGSSASPVPQEPDVQHATRPESRPSDSSQEKVKEKFFVVKSLTTEDLERSVQSGVWATQAHNEAALTGAYESTEDVYLIFSANKSGEYFGYARMDSAIGDESAASKTESLPTPVVSTSPSPAPVDVPMTITTPPTATAPKGRIMDDSSRGTIFWEAIHARSDIDGAKDSDEPTPAGSEDVSSGETANDSAVSGPPTPQSFGKPFKIVWVSTNRLPFYRTRGLRNPWNANREVKIARDGTEIEPSVGRRLVQMFHDPALEPPPLQQQQQQQQQQHHPHHPHHHHHHQINVAGVGRGMPPPMPVTQMAPRFLPPPGGGGGMMPGHPTYGGGSYQ